MFSQSPYNSHRLVAHAQIFLSINLGPRDGVPQAGHFLHHLASLYVGLPGQKFTGSGRFSDVTENRWLLKLYLRFTTDVL